jgi:anti-sigma factor RsiW
MKDRSQQIDRYLDGNLDADEIKELFAWLAESPQNAEVFARQSLLDQHLTTLLDGGFVKPLETPLEESSKPETVQINVRSWRRSQRLVWAGGLAAACLIIFLSLIALIRSQEVADLENELDLARRDAAPTETEESTIINIYAREHQDVVARNASLSPAQPEPMQMRVNQDDILYYERLDDQPETMHPGIIVRRPSYQAQINTSQIPAISNGHTLTLSEARDTIDFDLVSPSWLLPCYRLDQIRLIEGRDALHLLYTNGINSISLFEQSLDGQRRLSHHDFREYAVYNNAEQEGVTILAWRDNALSYVLIGNTELSQLMDVAQSIKATK